MPIEPGPSTVMESAPTGVTAGVASAKNTQLRLGWEESNLPLRGPEGNTRVLTTTTTSHKAGAAGSFEP